ncbi:MAG: hypothetical protein WDO73_14195 [Ignavibacteriota bacterium]
MTSAIASFQIFAAALVSAAGLPQSNKCHLPHSEISFSISYSITWDGYEFLASMKDDTAWRNSHTLRPDPKPHHQRHQDKEGPVNNQQ